MLVHDWQVPKVQIDSDKHRLAEFVLSASLMDPEQYLEPPRRSLVTTNFVAVDPFRPSVSLGIRNLIGNRRTEATIDDIPIPVDVMSRLTPRNSSEVHHRRYNRSRSPMTRRSRTRGRSAYRRYARRQHADVRHIRPISSASSSRSPSSSGRGRRDRRRSSLTGRSSAPFHDHRQVPDGHPGVPVPSELNLLTSATRQRMSGGGQLSAILEQGNVGQLITACSAYYPSVASSISRVPLSQSPANDERKSSLDAVVEGNLHGLSVRSPFTKLHQGSLPSSTSDFDIAIEPPVFFNLLLFAGL